jgi:Fusaric acid resistance protein-like
MDAYSSSASTQRASWIVRFARQADHVLCEIHEANKRASRLLLSYGVTESDRPRTATPSSCSGRGPASCTSRRRAAGRPGTGSGRRARDAGTRREVLPPQRSYWVPLTAAIVLKPDYGSVFARALQRGFGTVVRFVPWRMSW